MTTELIILYFVSLGLCSLSTIYKTFCFKSMLCRQIMGNMLWSLVPVVNTFKAILFLISLIRKPDMPDQPNTE
jgi:hypothetical protein